MDISERMSRTSRAAWRFMFESVMLDWGIVAEVLGYGVYTSSLAQLCTYVMYCHVTVQLTPHFKIHFYV